MPRVSSLYRYPVKSCKGVGVGTLEFDDLGPIGDRRWMVIDAGTRAFVTQRSHPSLALIEASCHGRDTIELSAPGQSPLTVSARDWNGGPISVRVWSSEVLARDSGDTAAQWLSEFLNTKVRLAGIDSNFRRYIKSGDGDQTGFADGYPLLIVSRPSLADLNHRLEFPVEMQRFRPNIVVDLCQPYEEDRWSRIKIGDVLLRAAGPCPRCAVTTVDPATGFKAGPEPLRTLSEYRKNSGGVMFGQNYINESKRGRIETGMEIELL